MTRISELGTNYMKTTLLIIAFASILIATLGAHAQQNLNTRIERPFMTQQEALNRRNCWAFRTLDRQTNYAIEERFGFLQTDAIPRYVFKPLSRRQFALYRFNPANGRYEMMPRPATTSQPAMQARMNGLILQVQQQQSGWRDALRFANACPRNVLALVSQYPGIAVPVEPAANQNAIAQVPQDSASAATPDGAGTEP